MERTKYDVFISYSRKDYVKDDVEIPGNPITAIMDCFDRNDVKYWVDKKGIYHGQEFIEVIADAIANSKMLVFVSSVHSNESIYTAGEILEALDGKKAVIPVKIDDSPYSKKFRIPLRPLDYIDYMAQPNTAVPELLRTVNKEKERIRRIEEQQSEELLNEQKKQEIAAGVKEFQRLNGEQDFLRRSLYSKSKDVGAKTKKCPVCDTEMFVDVPYCESCGWGFASLYGVYGVDGKSLHDEKQLRIVRGLWQDLKDGKDCKKRIEEIAAILEEERKMKEKYEEQSCNLERTAYSLEKEKRAQQERLNSMQSELHETTDKLNKTQRDLFESKKLYGDAIKNNHELEKRANSFEQQYKEMKVRKEEAEHIVVERENELEKVRKEKDDILNQLTTAKNGIAEPEKIMKGNVPTKGDTQPKASTKPNHATQGSNGTSSICDLVLIGVPDFTKRLSVIAAIKHNTTLSLHEAKDLVDEAPSTLYENISLREASVLKKKMEEAGAEIELSKEGWKYRQIVYEVVLTGIPDLTKKLAVVKTIKDITSLGLAESKMLADRIPSTISRHNNSKAAEKEKRLLEDAGASVKVLLVGGS